MREEIEVAVVAGMDVGIEVGMDVGIEVGMDIEHVQRYFGNERRERHRGRLSSTTWGIVIWEPSLILLAVVVIGAIIYMNIYMQANQKINNRGIQQ